MLDSIPVIRVVEIIDLVLVALLLWAGIVWLRTARARLALVGLLFLGSFALLARQIGLPLMASLLQAVVAASVFIVVVVFQEDIRRLFEQIASLGIRRRGASASSDTVEVLTRSMADLANAHRGALVVIPGRDPLERHLDGGVRLEAMVSEPLLLSLFDPHSAGHDGAVVVSGDRVKRFAVHLPLSSDHRQLGQRGTRHAAALGLAERSDALCIVVSEERGTVSIASNGRLRALPRPELVGDEVRGFLTALAPGESGVSLARRVAARWREGLAALGAALALWLMANPGAAVVQVQRDVPIRIRDLPASFAIEMVEPPELSVTVSGRRRDLLFLDWSTIEVRIDATLAQLGRRTFSVGPPQVAHPRTVDVVAVEPDSVKLSLKQQAP